MIRLLGCKNILLFFLILTLHHFFSDIFNSNFLIMYFQNFNYLKSRPSETGLK